MATRRSLVIKPSIKLLKKKDTTLISEAFAEIGWEKPVSQYERYLEEQALGERVVFVASVKDRFAGYVTIVWESPYPFFWKAGIPEIVDLNVIPCLRRQGIGTTLMDKAESRISQRSPLAGIGVGMTADYGPAQQMYVTRGYIPDGRGLIRNCQPLTYGACITVDDGLTLYFTKVL